MLEWLGAGLSQHTFNPTEDCDRRPAQRVVTGFSGEGAMGANSVCRGYLFT